VVAAIGNGAGFTQGRDFSAWLGLVPKQESTGDRTILGKISKRGNKYLRTLFVQAAHVVLAQRPNAAMWSLWPWIEQASRRLHRNMLAIALANKLARIALFLRAGTPISQGSLPMPRDTGSLRSTKWMPAIPCAPPSLTGRDGRATVAPGGWLHVIALTPNIGTEIE
jgi:hypothetical protein